MSETTKYLTVEELAAKRLWRDRPLKERQAHLSDVLVLHPQFVGAVREVDRRVARVKAQGKGNAFAIVAPTGAGKSTVARFIAAQYPDEHTDELTKRRCVVFSVPPRPSSISMSSALLRSLGDPQWNKGKADNLESRATHMLIEAKTEIVLIDNVHDVPERRKHSGVREVGNWIRNLIDNVPALIVSLGAEQGLDVFKANSQARRRSPAHKKIEYFSCMNTQGVRSMRRFLYEVDKQLPLASMSDLSSFDTTQRIWMASYGIPDFIVALLTEAIECAVRAKREQIQLDDLKLGYQNLFLDAVSEQNPFDLTTQIRLLDNKDEPFEDWLEDGYA